MEKLEKAIKKTTLHVMEKNCNNCWWSRREVKNLLLQCQILEHHPATIDNTYEMAKHCYSYTPATKPPKNTQLKLKLT